MQSPNDSLDLWGTVGALVMQYAEPQQKTANSWCAGNAAPAKDSQTMCLRLEKRPPLLEFVLFDLYSQRVQWKLNITASVFMQSNI